MPKSQNPIYALGYSNLEIAKLKKAEAAYGIRRMLMAVKTYKPRVVCFIGKVTYRMFENFYELCYFEIRIAQRIYWILAFRHNSISCNGY